MASCILVMLVRNGYIYKMFILLGSVSSPVAVEQKEISWAMVGPGPGSSCPYSLPQGTSWEESISKGECSS